MTDTVHRSVPEILTEALEQAEYWLEQPDRTIEPDEILRVIRAALRVARAEWNQPGLMEALVQAARRYHEPCERKDGHCSMLPIERDAWCRACDLSAALRAYWGSPGADEGAR